MMLNTYMTYILNANQNLNTQVKNILIPYKNPYLPDCSHSLDHVADMPYAMPLCNK